MKRVYLEITNSCNLNCPFCTNNKGNNFLSYEQVANYLEQIKPYSNYVYLHMLGEPLLHPNFNEILNKLDKLNLNLQLVTNGTLLYKFPDILEHSCLRKLSISIHSVNNIDINDDYFKTIDQLINKNKHSNIELRFYDYDNLSDKLKHYLDSLKEKYNFEITPKKNSYKLKENTYVYFEELFRWPNINDEIINDTGTCHGAIDMIGINSSSEVTICCLDPYAYNTIGNLKKQTLKDILDSEKYKQYISDFKSHQIKSELCKRCSYRLRFR